jgi:hypothetical protein
MFSGKESRKLVSEIFLRILKGPIFLKSNLLFGRFVLIFLRMR